MKHTEDLEKGLSKQISLDEMIEDCENEERDRKRKEETIRQIEKYIF